MTIRVKCFLCKEILECQRSDTINLLMHVQEKHPQIRLHNFSNEINSQNLDQSKSATNSLLTMAHIQKYKNDDEPSSNDDISEKFIKQNINSESSEEPSGPHVSINYPQIDEIPKEIHNEKKKFPNDDSMTSVIRQIINANKLACRCEDQESSNLMGELLKDPKANEFVKKPQVIYKREYRPKSYLKPNQRKKLYKTSVEKWKPGRAKITCPNCGATKRPVIRSYVDKVSHSQLGAAFLLTCWPFCFMPCLFAPPKKEYLHCALCQYCLGIYDQKEGNITPNSV